MDTFEQEKADKEFSEKFFIPEGEELFAVILPEELEFLEEMLEKIERAQRQMIGAVKSVCLSGYVPVDLEETVKVGLAKSNLFHFKLGQMYADRQWNS